jgi:hypothetical protein
VGLTVLNEQTIEMMFATFVYPMLLQPLSIFKQRFEQLVEPHCYNNASHPLRGFGGCNFVEVEYQLVHVSSSAKAALFAIGGIFQLLTHRPLLRLLYVALFHPLSPDTSSVPTVRTHLEVATLDRNGKPMMRLDPKPLLSSSYAQTNERESYPFGTISKQRQLQQVSRVPSFQALEGSEACVFVLSPALAEVLEFRGNDLGLLSRTKPNPYRNAFLRCLELPEEMIELKEFACCALSSALTVFHAEFATDILFGSDLKSYDDDMPADERDLDSIMAHDEDDRGMGSSRINVNRQRGVHVGGGDLTTEIVTALCRNVIGTSKDYCGALQLEYNPTAAHVLLSLARINTRALTTAVKILENRYQLASYFVAGIPSTLCGPSGIGGGWDDSPVVRLMAGAPSFDTTALFDDSKITDYEYQILDGVLNMIFFDLPLSPSRMSILQEANIIKDIDPAANYLLPISFAIDYVDMSNQSGRHLTAHLAREQPREVEMIHGARDSILAFFRTNAILLLLRNTADSPGVLRNNESIAGVAFLMNGTALSLKPDLSNKAERRQTYSSISPNLVEVLLSQSASATDVPVTGTMMSLSGMVALPCVCETPASAAYLFADDDRCSVVAEGVTWQSLFVCTQDEHFILAQPQPQSDVIDSARIISACLLERVTVEQDTYSGTDDSNESPARRLVVYYKWFDVSTPPLFMFDAMPEEEKIGVSCIRAREYISSLDIWFEDQDMANQAYAMLVARIYDAKARRGNRLYRLLNPYNSSSSYRWHLPVKGSFQL